MSTKRYPLLARGYVRCDRAQGDLFDFQEDYGLSALPQCTRLPSPTYFQGSIIFHVGLPNCSLHSLHADFVPTLSTALQKRASQLCEKMVCDNITFVCESAALRNASDPSTSAAAMKVVWTVQAMHVIDGDNNAVPPAETLIQKLQVLSHDIITSDLDFYKEIAQVGGDVWQDSFKQSQFRLVCGSKGFTIDNESGLCVQCAAGTFEENGACHPCPENHFQDNEGQTSCKPCPKHTFSQTGSTTVGACTEFDWLDLPEASRDQPYQDLHSGPGMPCDPSPCQHYGV